jgi:GDP-L-fucose synthase
MKILITGANGFLGSHIKKRFNFFGSNILTPKSSELDILNYSDLLNYLQTNKPDCILHMAAKCGGILANKNSPADFLHSNTQMALNIYDAALKSNIEYVYSLGSVCAYPKFCPIPFKEDDIWNGAAEETNFPYGQAKRTLLMLSQTYRQQYGLKGVHLIPINLYGEYDHFDLINSHVLPALINKMTDAIATNKEIINCFGTGNATREFLYAGDAAEAIVNAVLSKIDTDLPINLGVGQDISIYDLAYLIKNISGYKGNIIFTNEVSDGQPKRLLDVSRAKQILNWSATTDLKDGIAKTIEWFISNEMQ